MFDVKDIALARLFKPDLSISKLDAGSLALLKIMNNATGGGVVPVYDADIANGIASFDGVTKSKPLVSLLLNIPVTQTGSGTPSPTNIRDFVGFTGAVIGQTNGYGEYFRGLLNGTYGFVDLGSLTWSLQNTNETCNRWRASSDILIASRSYNNINNFTDDGWFQGVSVTSTTTTTNRIDTREGIIYLNIEKTVFDGDATEFNTWAQGKYLIYELAEPSTPITPEQFATLCQAFGITGNTYSISFGQTVYSAILDVLTGKLYLFGVVDLGSLNWRYGSGSQVFYTEDITDMSEAIPFNNMACSGFEVLNSPVSLSNMTNYSIKRGNTESTKKSIYVKDTDYTVASDFTTAVTGMKLVYELAEPIEVQLTPTEVQLLEDNNTLFADTGDLTLTYKAKA